MDVIYQSVFLKALGRPKSGLLLCMKGPSASAHLAFIDTYTTSLRAQAKLSI